MADEMIRKSEFLEYMESFERRVNIQFEETRSLVRLSLEGLEVSRETTERGFAEVQRTNRENKILLEAALTHVRRRMEKVERTRAKRG
jgi:hypothetical protein